MHGGKEYSKKFHCLFTTKKGVTICTTGIQPPERDRLHDLIAWMGGKADAHLSPDVTHLIASDTTSEKYRTAVQLGLRIVNPKWIISSWEKNQQQSADDFRIPPFYGLTISVTGIHGGEYLTVACL